MNPIHLDNSEKWNIIRRGGLQMFEKALLKYDGEAREFVLNSLDLANPENPTDEDLKHAICMAAGIPDLDGYVVQRAETIINICPNHVFAAG